MSNDDNAFDKMRAAINQAKDTFRAADNAAGELAYWLSGRLRNVPSHRLKALKRELSRFNAHTGEWKD